jgi:hypothetical protein
MDKKQATAHIRHKAQTLQVSERERFLEVAETELQSLHEGNFARYRVRPSEFATWRASWR